MLGRGDHVTVRGIHYHNAPFTGGWDVHIVQTYAGPADDFELICGLDHLLGYLGGTADHQAVIVLDDANQFLWGEAGIHLHLEVRCLFQSFNALFMEGITHQNLHGTQHSKPKKRGILYGPIRSTVESELCCPKNTMESCD